MWRGRRTSGYGHTAVQPVITGSVRQHLLCQHSSRQPRGRRAENRLQSSETDGGEAEHRRAEPRVRSGHVGVHVSVTFSLKVTGSNPVCPTLVSLTKTDWAQADHDL